MDERTFVVPVESTHVLQFARACGYPDAPRSVPTPTFLVAADTFDPDYERRPRPDRPWFGSGGAAAGASDQVPARGRSGYHAGEDLTYHRPVRVGETLTARTHDGDTWTKPGRKGGSLRFREIVTEFVAADGELVVTARWINVSTTNEVLQ
jgi:hypothetical protein